MVEYIHAENIHSRDFFLHNIVDPSRWYCQGPALNDMETQSCVAFWTAPSAKTILMRPFTLPFSPMQSTWWSLTMARHSLGCKNSLKSPIREWLVWWMHEPFLWFVIVNAEILSQAYVRYDFNDDVNLTDTLEYWGKEFRGCCSILTNLFRNTIVASGEVVVSVMSSRFFSRLGRVTEFPVSWQHRWMSTRHWDFVVV